MATEADTPEITHAMKIVEEDKCLTSGKPEIPVTSTELEDSKDGLEQPLETAKHLRETETMQIPIHDEVKTKNTVIEGNNATTNCESFGEESSTPGAINEETCRMEKKFRSREVQNQGQLEMTVTEKQLQENEIPEAVEERETGECVVEEEADKRDKKGNNKIALQMKEGSELDVKDEEEEVIGKTDENRDPKSGKELVNDNEATLHEKKDLVSNTILSDGRVNRGSEQVLDVHSKDENIGNTSKIVITPVHQEVREANYEEVNSTEPDKSPTPGSSNKDPHASMICKDISDVIDEVENITNSHTEVFHFPEKPLSPGIDIEREETLEAGEGSTKKLTGPSIVLETDKTSTKEAEPDVRENPEQRFHDAFLKDEEHMQSGEGPAITEASAGKKENEVLHSMEAEANICATRAREAVESAPNRKEEQEENLLHRDEPVKLEGPLACEESRTVASGQDFGATTCVKEEKCSHDLEKSLKEEAQEDKSDNISDISKDNNQMKDNTSVALSESSGAAEADIQGQTYDADKSIAAPSLDVPAGNDSHVEVARNNISSPKVIQAVEHMPQHNEDSEEAQELELSLVPELTETEASTEIDKTISLAKEEKPIGSTNENIKDRAEGISIDTYSTRKDEEPVEKIVLNEEIKEVTNTSNKSDDDTQGKLMLHKETEQKGDEYIVKVTEEYISNTQSREIVEQMAQQENSDQRSLLKNEAARMTSQSLSSTDVVTEGADQNCETFTSPEREKAQDKSEEYLDENEKKDNPINSHDIGNRTEEQKENLAATTNSEEKSECKKTIVGVPADTVASMPVPTSLGEGIVNIVYGEDIEAVGNISNIKVTEPFEHKPKDEEETKQSLLQMAVQEKMKKKDKYSLISEKPGKGASSETIETFTRVKNEGPLDEIEKDVGEAGREHKLANDNVINRDEDPVEKGFQLIVVKKTGNINPEGHISEKNASEMLYMHSSDGMREDNKIVELAGEGINNSDIMKDVAHLEEVEKDLDETLPQQENMGIKKAEAFVIFDGTETAEPNKNDERMSSISKGTYCENVEESFMEKWKEDKLTNNSDVRKDEYPRKKNIVRVNLNETQDRAQEEIENPADNFNNLYAMDKESGKVGHEELAKADEETPTGGKGPDRSSCQESEQEKINSVELLDSTKAETAASSNTVEPDTCLREGILNKEHEQMIEHKHFLAVDASRVGKDVALKSKVSSNEGTAVREMISECPQTLEQTSERKSIVIKDTVQANGATVKAEDLETDIIITKGHGSASATNDFSPLGVSSTTCIGNKVAAQSFQVENQNVASERWNAECEAEKSEIDIQRDENINQEAQNSVHNAKVAKKSDTEGNYSELFPGFTTEGSIKDHQNLEDEMIARTNKTCSDQIIQAYEIPEKVLDTTMIKQGALQGVGDKLSLPETSTGKTSGEDKFSATVTEDYNDYNGLLKAQEKSHEEKVKTEGENKDIPQTDELPPKLEKSTNVIPDEHLPETTVSSDFVGTTAIMEKEGPCQDLAEMPKNGMTEEVKVSDDVSVETANQEVFEGLESPARHVEDQTEETDNVISSSLVGDEAATKGSTEEITDRELGFPGQTEAAQHTGKPISERLQCEAETARSFSDSNIPESVEGIYTHDRNQNLFRGSSLAPDNLDEENFHPNSETTTVATGKTGSNHDNAEDQNRICDIDPAEDGLESTRIEDTNSEKADIGMQQKQMSEQCINPDEAQCHTKGVDTELSSRLQTEKAENPFPKPNETTEVKDPRDHGEEMNSQAEKKQVTDKEIIRAADETRNNDIFKPINAPISDEETESSKKEIIDKVETSDEKTDFKSVTSMPLGTKLGDAPSDENPVKTFAHISDEQTAHIVETEASICDERSGLTEDENGAEVVEVSSIGKDVDAAEHTAINEKGSEDHLLQNKCKEKVLFEESLVSEEGGKEALTGAVDGMSSVKPIDNLEESIGKKLKAGKPTDDNNISKNEISEEKDFSHTDFDGKVDGEGAAIEFSANDVDDLHVPKSVDTGDNSINTEVMETEESTEKHKEDQDKHSLQKNEREKMKLERDLDIKENSELTESVLSNENLRSRMPSDAVTHQSAASVESSVNFANSLDEETEIEQKAELHPGARSHDHEVTIAPSNESLTDKVDEGVQNTGGENIKEQVFKGENNLEGYHILFTAKETVEKVVVSNPLSSGYFEAANSSVQTKEYLRNEEHLTKDGDELITKAAAADKETLDKESVKLVNTPLTAYQDSEKRTEEIAQEDKLEKASKIISDKKDLVTTESEANSCGEVDNAKIRKKSSEVVTQPPAADLQIEEKESPTTRNPDADKVLETKTGPLVAMESSEGCGEVGDMVTGEILNTDASEETSKKNLNIISKSICQGVEEETQIKSSSEQFFVVGKAEEQMRTSSFELIPEDQDYGTASKEEKMIATEMKEAEIQEMKSIDQSAISTTEKACLQKDKFKELKAVEFESEVNPEGWKSGSAEIHEDADKERDQVKNEGATKLEVLDSILCLEEKRKEKSGSERPDPSEVEDYGEAPNAVFHPRDQHVGRDGKTKQTLLVETLSGDKDIEIENSTEAENLQTDKPEEFSSIKALKETNSQGDDVRDTETFRKGIELKKDMRYGSYEVVQEARDSHGAQRIELQESKSERNNIVSFSGGKISKPDEVVEYSGTKSERIGESSILEGTETGDNLKGEEPYVKREEYHNNRIAEANESKQDEALTEEVTKRKIILEDSHQVSLGEERTRDSQKEHQLKAEENSEAVADELQKEKDAGRDLMKKQGSTGSVDSNKITQDGKKLDKTSHSVVEKKTPKEEGHNENKETPITTGCKEISQEFHDPEADSLQEAKVSDLETENLRGHENEGGKRTDNLYEGSTDESTLVGSAKSPLPDLPEGKEKMQVAEQGSEDKELHHEAEGTLSSKETKMVGEEGAEHKETHSGSDGASTILSKDTDSKVPHKKPHHLLSGMGSKVKNSILKVKKAISCSSHIDITEHNMKATEH